MQLTQLYNLTHLTASTPQAVAPVLQSTVSVLLTSHQCCCQLCFSLILQRDPCPSSSTSSPLIALLAVPHHHWTKGKVLVERGTLTDCINTCTIKQLPLVEEPACSKPHTSTIEPQEPYRENNLPPNITTRGSGHTIHVYKQQSTEHCSCRNAAIISYDHADALHKAQTSMS